VPDEEAVVRTEAESPVEGDRPLRRAQDDANVIVVVSVGEQCAQQQRADPLAAVGAEYERVRQVPPGAGLTAGAWHAVEDRQVHHAYRLAGNLGQPGDPAARLALVPVEETGLESLVIDIAVLLSGPRAAQRREGGPVAGVGDPDDWGGHERRAYRHR
jgi:hypothetical protein